MLLLRSHVVDRVRLRLYCAPEPQHQSLAFLLVIFAMSTSTSCPIPGGRDRLPDCYSTTPGGTLYATTPGGTRIIYDRKFLLECKNSPIARTPPCCLPQIPGVTTPPTAPLSKLEELKEQKETEEETPDDAQFEMDI
ncbi:eukaryotic translation initiation factor 4E binding protein 3 [Rhinolophus ferrumequinum]|uniref:Eukaryotic translation initiation factor 4E binding protein 3 n=2 Tax=Rhinolophus ferrumequinum TaxID=59479 RepID=A0A7J7RWV4_RHIFE|nr:eukaryotic translation initiation factor 4E-binding protein 3 isoform X2 [Rhinolophus ferrumequinum]KAF6280618.1 eukaryotic translation initiation factor 4E binding protein 3 [Rhinolophus ferrumequinum]